MQNQQTNPSMSDEDHDELLAGTFPASNPVAQY